MSKCYESAASAALKLLTEHVRVLGAHQVPGLGPRSASALFKRLARRELLSLRMVMAPPELPLEAPVFSWKPGENPPHAERIAWQLTSRWTARPIRVLVATATPRAAAELGGTIGGRRLRRTEASHDLHVTALYLKLLAGDPERAALWRHEDSRPARGTLSGLVADARIGEVAIEFGGKYRAEKLKRIHRGHAGEGRAYEIW
jgi:hypothetical protein